MNFRLPKIRLSDLRKIFLSIIVISLIFWGGYTAGQKGLKASGFPKVTISRDNPANREDVDFTLFWRVWDTLDASYFDKEKIDQAELVYGAIKGMVAAVGDPYTVFLPPNENKVVQEDLSGSFEGIGIHIGFRGSQLAVIAPLTGSPAEKAGVEAGDFIVGIKDEAAEIERGTVGITLPEAVKIIRGPAGSVVTLTLLREGQDEPLVVDITRASIEVPSIVTEFVGEDSSVAHIKILKFSGETLDEWNKAVSDILKKPEVRGIIIDVRNNPGGFLQSAVDIASEFIDNQSVVVVEEDADKRRNEYLSERIGRLTSRPLIVLVNKGSASASEILAGALRDLKGTTLVGEATFGKGTIQEPRQINGGAALHITTARWLTPESIWVNEEGLTPDIEIENDSETDEDEQLQRAIEEVLKL